MSEGFDPNLKSASPELAVVLRGQQDLQNKHLGAGRIGAVLDVLRRSTLNIEDQYRRMAVVDDDTYAKAGVILKAVKEVLKKSDTDRKTFTSPIMALKAAVDAAFKATADDALAALKIGIEGKMLAYVNEKREREAKELAEALAKQAHDQGNEGASQLMAEALSETDETVESHGVTTQIRKRTQYVVTDFRAALKFIAEKANDSEIQAIVTLSSRALAKFAERESDGLLGAVLPGLKQVEVDTIVNI